MANTYVLIASTTLTSTQSTVEFTGIPSTYTDLILNISARTNQSGTSVSYCRLTFNGSSSNYSEITLDNSLGTAYSNKFSNRTYIGVNNTLYLPGPTVTSDTFGSAEIYIPSYTVSQSKPLTTFFLSENTSTTAIGMATEAALWRDNSAISSIAVLSTDGTSSFVSGSNFYLYGIKNS